MTIDFDTYKEIVDRVRADIAQNLPGVDPTIFGSYVRALGDAVSGRAFDIELIQEQMLLQFFPQTATGSFLELWASYEDLTRNPATGSTGPVTFTGTIGSVIPLGTQARSSDGNIYETLASLTLENQAISVTSLTRSGNEVTGITASNHLAASGQDLDITGAVETEYNGTHEITVTGSDSFTYQIAATPTSPATGTIIADFDGGSVDIDSQETASETAPASSLNLDSGAQLNLVSPIAGVDTTARVQFGEVGGATDTEKDDELRVRVFQSRANPVANFNIAAITKKALSVPGVTRLLVKRITPYVGAVTVLFVRDNDSNIIPSASEVSTVKDAVLEILQASSAEADVFVLAPTPVTVNFTFTGITPDTATMRSAIEQNLIAFFQDDVTFETDITEDKYRAAIINTIDPETGDSVSSFTLSEPSGDVAVTTNEIGVLGAIIFP